MIEELNNICYQLGQDIFFTQAAGGNVSIKDHKSMKIKASGKWLSDAIKENIFVDVEIDYSQKNDHGDVLPSIIQKSTRKLKPSIETVVHAVIPGKIVVHIHHLNSIVHLISSDCENLITRKLKGFKFPFEIIKYVKPGKPLAIEIYNCLLRNPETKIFLLKNHGVFFSADSVEQIIEQINSLDELFHLENSLTVKSVLRLDLDNTKMLNLGLELIPSSIVQSIVHQENSEELLKNLWALYPDHLVFLGDKAQFIQKSSVTRLKKEEILPGIYFIINQGVYFKGPCSSTQLQYLDCFAQVLHRIIDHNKVNTLSLEHIEEIVNWESEKYRINLSK